MLTISTIGGLLLCAGAVLSFKGKVYQAVAVYLFADVCWIWLSYVREDYQGFVFTIIGTALGIGTFFKMYRGLMRKSLDLK